MIPDENRFQSDVEEALPGDFDLPTGWLVEGVDDSDERDVEQLTHLLRDHQRGGKGWASADEDDVLLEISARGTRTRENVVIRDREGTIRAWGSVHDRAAGRMLFVHIVDRELTGTVAQHCSNILFDWARTQAREVGAARGLSVQQIDTGAFEQDPRQHEWLAGAGFQKVRTWWQMTRAVDPAEANLVDAPERWEHDAGVVFRLVDRDEVDPVIDDAGGPSPMPDEEDLRAVHEVLEGAFTDHFNSREETLDEFIHRLRQEPGHRWAHWWLAEVTDDDGEVTPAGALVGSVSGSDGAYVDYLGVLSVARGRGVAKGLLNTIIADTAARGRTSIGLEVDADSPTGAHELYTSMGWETSYITQSWHLDVPVE